MTSSTIPAWVTTRRSEESGAGAPVIAPETAADPAVANPASSGGETAGQNEPGVRGRVKQLFAATRQALQELRGSEQWTEAKKNLAGVGAYAAVKFGQAMYASGKGAAGAAEWTRDTYNPGELRTARRMLLGRAAGAAALSGIWFLASKYDMLPHVQGVEFLPNATPNDQHLQDVINSLLNKGN